MGNVNADSNSSKMGRVLVFVPLKRSLLCSSRRTFSFRVNKALALFHQGESVSDAASLSINDPFSGKTTFQF